MHMLVTKIRVPKTRIGYCPMFPASAAEFNTVYTIMKVFQWLFRALRQEWTYVMHDEAIVVVVLLLKYNLLNNNTYIQLYVYNK